NISALFGGILLAIGSRMAGGCNVKLLMSGLPLLSIQAFLFLFGMLPGAWLGTYLFKKLVISYDREGGDGK
uniref:YeeE/YedE thiosulfate transporter family protein n=1 Tax=Dissulfurispira sp. TaxID=2817609 RepID=UPI002FD8D963